MRTNTTFRKLLLFSVFFFPSVQCLSQISIASLGVPYTQNFNAVAAAAANNATATFTNNSTIAGWYSSETQIRTQLPGSARINTGDFYCVIDGADKSIGTRPSGSTGAIDYGVRLVNNTGTAVTSVRISYTGEQWSIAENNGNVNFISVGYRVGTNIVSSTTGTWTNIGSLQFNQIYGNTNSTALGGTACGGTSNQCLALNGNLTANRTQLTTCLAVNIPAGQEIFIRFADADNTSNDHHLQIDDVSVTMFNVTCSVVLPVTWVDVKATANGNMKAKVEWSVASERNNDYFEILMASDESPAFEIIGKVFSAGDTEQLRHYSFERDLVQSGNYYFRVRQTDKDGKNSWSEMASLKVSNDRLFVFCEAGTSTVRFSKELQEGTKLTLFDISGRDISHEILPGSTSFKVFETAQPFSGYLVVEEKDGVSSFMISF